MLFAAVLCTFLSTANTQSLRSPGQVYGLSWIVCRSLSVHPSLPYLLSASDDLLIKLWDWDKVRKRNVLIENLA